MFTLNDKWRENERELFSARDRKGRNLGEVWIASLELAIQLSIGSAPLGKWSKPLALQAGDGSSILPRGILVYTI